MLAVVIIIMTLIVNITNTHQAFITCQTLSWILAGKVTGTVVFTCYFGAIIIVKILKVATYLW